MRKFVFCMYSVKYCISRAQIGNRFCFQWGTKFRFRLNFSSNHSKRFIFGTIRFKITSNRFDNSGYVSYMCRYESG